MSNSLESLTEELIAAQTRLNSGHMSHAAYKTIERRIIPQLKELNHQRYGHAMGLRNVRRLREIQAIGRDVL